MKFSALQEKTFKYSNLRLHWSSRKEITCHHTLVFVIYSRSDRCMHWIVYGYKKWT